MKRVFVTTLISLVALTVAAPAPAAGPTVKSLARQIKALQKEVKTLKTQVTQARSVAATALVYSACTTAVTVDVFQSAWTYLDQEARDRLSSRDSGERLPDLSAAADDPRPAQVPPNTAVFSSLLALFRS